LEPPIWKERKAKDETSKNTGPVAPGHGQRGKELGKKTTCQKKKRGGGKLEGRALFRSVWVQKTHNVANVWQLPLGGVPPNIGRVAENKLEPESTGGGEG